MKYKLIKEYPGGPELGSVAESYGKGKSMHYTYNHPTTKGVKLAVPLEQIEQYPEYWEKLDDCTWYVVFEEDFYAFKPWIPHLIETFFEYKNRFKTREEAEFFILNNKPCLSYKEVKKILGEESENRKIISKLSELIKSKL